MEPIEFVRVKDKETGHEVSVPVEHYDNQRDVYDLLEKKPATDSAGDPLPAKYKTTVATAAARKTTTRKRAAKKTASNPTGTATAAETSTEENS